MNLHISNYLLQVCECLWVWASCKGQSNYDVCIVISLSTKVAMSLLVLVLYLGAFFIYTNAWFYLQVLCQNFVIKKSTTSPMIEVFLYSSRTMNIGWF